MLPFVSDETMRERLAGTATYTLAILRRTERYGTAGTEALIWEHGRRNMALVQEGLLPVVCPVGDDTGLAGVGIFTGGIDEIHALLAEDPAIEAGILSYTLHPCRGFPGAQLPAQS